MVAGRRNQKISAFTNFLEPTEFYYFRRSFDLISRLPKSYNGLLVVLFISIAIL